MFAFLLAAITLVLQPRLAFAPANVRALVKIIPAPANRTAVMQLDGDDYYRRSDEQLEGADAPTSRWLQFSALPCGTYVFTVTVLDNRAQVLNTASTTLMVKGDCDSTSASGDDGGRGGSHPEHR